MSLRIISVMEGGSHFTQAVDPESESGDNKHCGRQYEEDNKHCSMQYELTNIVLWIKRVSLRIISVMEGGSHFPWAVDPESELGDNKHCGSVMSSPSRADYPVWDTGLTSMEGVLWN